MICPSSENNENKMEFEVGKIEIGKDEKKEIKIPIKEGDLQDETVSQLIKEKIEKDSKETVVGRKGCVDEGRGKVEIVTNVDLMAKLEELIKLNKKFLERLGSIWKHKRWLEHEILEKNQNESIIKETESEIKKQSAEDLGQEIGKLIANFWTSQK